MNTFYCVIGHFSADMFEEAEPSRILYVGGADSKDTAMNISNFPIPYLEEIEIQIWQNDVHIETWVDTHYDTLERVWNGEIK